MDQATIVAGALLAMFAVWVIVNGKTATYLGIVGL